MAEYLQLRDLHKALNADVVKKARARGHSPSWLKDMAGQLEDPEYVGLSLADRGFLKDLRLLALRRGNKILNDEQYLRVQLRLTPRTQVGPYVSRLRAAGFLEEYDETTNNAAIELNPQGAGLEHGETGSRLEVEGEVEEPPTPFGKNNKTPDTKLPFLAGATAIWNTHNDQKQATDAVRIWLEGFTDNQTLIDAHLAALGGRARAIPSQDSEAA